MLKMKCNKNNYDYVFDLNSVLYAGGENIEALVKKQLGISSEN